MDEFEIELDDDVAEMIRQQAEKSGLTFEEQASVTIRRALEDVVNTATSDEPKSPPAGNPTA